MEKRRRGRGMLNSVINVNEGTRERCGDGFYQRFGRTGPPVQSQCDETRTHALKRGRGEYPGCETDAMMRRE